VAQPRVRHPPRYRNLTGFSGNPTYDGSFLVIGKGTVTKNGGGNGTLNGAMLVANMFDGSGNPIPWVPAMHQARRASPGTAEVLPSLTTISCWVNYGSRPLPFRTISDRELHLLRRTSWMAIGFCLNTRQQRPEN